jgi:hypothetical protein
MKEDCWMVNNGNIIRVNIQKIGMNYTHLHTNPSFTYDVFCEKGMHYCVVEKDLYRTKEECALIWLQSQGLEVGIK